MERIAAAACCSGAAAMGVGVSACYETVSGFVAAQVHDKGKHQGHRQAASVAKVAVEGWE